MSDISVWGILLVAVLAAVAAVLLWVVDHRVLGRLLRVRLPRLDCASRRVPLCWWLPAAGAVVLGSVVGAGCYVLAFGDGLFWPAAGLLLVLSLATVPRGVRTYRRSLMHTKAHRRYLLANGATALESVMPSVRRALRSAVLPLTLHRTSPMVLVLPLLLFALLMGGCPLVAALVALLLLWLLSLSVAVLATVLALWLSSCWESALAKRLSKRL